MNYRNQTDFFNEIWLRFCVSCVKYNVMNVIRVKTVVRVSSRRREEKLIRTDRGEKTKGVGFQEKGSMHTAISKRRRCSAPGETCRTFSGGEWAVRRRSTALLEIAATGPSTCSQLEMSLRGALWGSVSAATAGLSCLSSPSLPWWREEGEPRCWRPSARTAGGRHQRTTGTGT